MAKKKRSHKKKHQRQDHSQEDFLAEAPERQAFQDEEVEEPEQAQAQEPEEIVEEITETPQQEDTSPQELSSPETQTEEEVTEEPQQESSFSLGNFLKQERESKGINIKSVSQSTKISTTNLEYLEEDNLAALPDKAYVIGYVKSYSRLLGLDVNFCLELLNKTYQAQGSAPSDPKIVIPQAQNSPQMDEQAPIGKIVAIVVMVIILLGLSWFFMSRSGETPETKEEVITEVSEDQSETEVVQTLNADTPLQDDISDQPIGEATPAPKEEIEEPIEEEPIKEEPVKEEPKVTETKKEEPKKEEEKKEEDDQPKEERKFYKMVMPLYSKDTTMTAETKEELLPDNFKVVPQEGIQAVFITATNGDSWLTYKSDNDPIKKFVLRKGRSLLFRAKEAQVFLGNLSAVKIFLNNEPLNVTSPSGVKSLIFPQEKAGDYVTPLFIYKKNGSVITSKEWIEQNQP
ncbi:MAG: helix-turn-helix transcriptional regulator [Bdellovibrionota bacterium]|nr:helix-turn-helix transcriptional regulator [Bdellovibrionota bacterium]